MPKHDFVGFSTNDAEITGKNTYYDIELVNRDLMNAFQTRIGERVMRPTYGCKLWDWVMEPMTPDLHLTIRAEVQRICESDSRVSVQSMVIYELNSGFRVEATLEYQPSRVIATFTQDFEARQSSSTSGVF